MKNWKKFEKKMKKECKVRKRIKEFRPVKYDFCCCGLRKGKKKRQRNKQTTII